MNRRQQLQDQYEDALFALLMNEVAKAEGEQYLDENERLKQDPEAEVPKQVMNRCQKVIRREFSKKNAAAVGRISWKAIKRLAIAACVGALLFTGALAVSEPLRVSTLNLLIKTFDTYTEFRMGEASPSKTPSHPAFEVGWLPSSYELIDSSVAETYTWKEYQGPNGEILYIDLSMVNESTVITIDTEDAEIEYITINGQEGMLVTKNGFHFHQFFLEKEMTLFVTLESKTGSVNREDFLRIIEKISILY